jgi:folate-binding protein YgfZ
MADNPHNPLLPLHQQAEAELQAYGDVQVVSTFGEPQAEYAAIRKGAGLIDLPQRGFIQLSGRDRLPFLNNLLTNQTFDKETKTALAAGVGVYAFLLAARTGRITADVNVLERGELTLLELDRRLIPTFTQTLTRYLFAEQVKIEPHGERLHEIALHGPTAAAILAQASGTTLDPLNVLGSQSLDLFGVTITLWRDDPAAVPGYHLVMPADAARTVWMNLLSRFGPDADPAGAAGQISKRRVRPVGWAVFNAARIEGGRPLFGIDFDDTILPAETGQLARAVSFTKGCYAGQEIVARMHARQQWAKQIVGIRFADDCLPIAGAPVYDDAHNQVGGITSSSISPVLSNAAIALALVKKPFTPPGTVVNVPAEGATRRGVVTDLPFLK